MQVTVYILILAIFMGCGVLGVDVAEEKTCEDKCKDICPACLDVKPCTENQIDCGPGPPSENPFCDPERVCVPLNCNCATKDNKGEDCASTCNVECGDGEKFCSGGNDEKGCKRNDYCVKKETDAEGNLCDGFCPVSCDDNEVKCPTCPNDRGCAQAPVCQPKQKDKFGKDCPTVCPICCKDDEVKCSGQISENGCKEADTCVKRDTDKDGALCPGTCPVECQTNEILCKGPVLENGCRQADVCHTKAKNVYGEYCPVNSDSHKCPKVCKEDETLCPAHEAHDQLGCMEEALCKKKTKTATGEYCPSTSVCHSPCKIHELSCAGGIDKDGCKEPDTCHKKGRDYNANLCPLECPGECKEDEIFCGGCINKETGCKDPDTCKQRGKKLIGPDAGETCTGFCPVNCQEDEIKCPTQLDPCDKCTTEEVCRPAAKNINGVFCDKDSASHNCPRLCDEKAGEVLCPAYENELGCKSKAMCMKKVKDPEGNDCPMHSACPKVCGKDQMLCADGLDRNGCKNPDRCLSRGEDVSGNLCPVQCPPVCSKDQGVCPGSTKENGCKDSDTCVAKVVGHDGADCRVVCPATCADHEYKIAGGIDGNGCPMDDICSVPKVFGQWINEGACVGDPAHSTCGAGTQHQVRTCTDGSNAFRFPAEKCTDSEKDRTVTCAAAGTQLPDCPEKKKCDGGDDCCNKNNQCGQEEGDCDKDEDCLNGLKCEFDGWWGSDYCKAGPETKNYEWSAWGEYTECSITCGADGTKTRTRTCTPPSSGGYECPDSKQTETETCNGGTCPEVAKELGTWTNDGACVATGADATCGPGDQKQVRTCVDGTTDKCTAADTEHTVPCRIAGTQLPDCVVVEKELGEWTNDGVCEGTGDDKTCGAGDQKQTRTCTDGTTDKCTDADKAQTVSCSDAGTPLPDCVVEKQLGEWTDDGTCEGTGADKTCGPGIQKQTRTCTDGSTDKCTDADTAQTIDCALKDCPVEAEESPAE